MIKYFVVWTLVILAFVFCSIWNLNTGESSLTLTEHLSFAFYEWRLPRYLVGALCGGIFGVSGLLLQTILRNPLAAPDVLGLSTGAICAILIISLIFPVLPFMAYMWSGLFGALAVFLLICFLSRKMDSRNVARIIIIGIAVGAFLKAIEQYILMSSATDISSKLALITGTIYAADWTLFWRIFPLAVMGLFAAFCMCKILNLLLLSDENVLSLGGKVQKYRQLLLFISVYLIGIAVMGAGSLGFVGLVAPNISRALLGHKHQQTLPMSFMIGSILVIAADTIGRTILPPHEIPAGLITTLLGAPYFLWLLKNSRSNPC